MERVIYGASFPLSVSNSRHYLILFLLWPFLAFLTAIVNYGQKEAKRVVYIFLVYYGFAFVVVPGMDSGHYALVLKNTAELPFSDFFKIVGGLYTETSVDIIQPLITFLISRFTSHHAFIFGAWAAVFSFFYLKSINLLHDRYKVNPGWNAMIFMAFFLMIMPITTVSGVRMPIAMWAFFYGAYHVVLYRDRRYLLLAAAASLMHWSFITANAVLFIYFFTGNRNIIYLPIAIASFLLPNLLAPLFQSLALMLGGPIQNRYEGYSSEGYILGIQESYEGASWFMGLGEDLVFYYLLVAIFIIQLVSGTLMKGRAERNLFSFLLLFLSFVNFGKAIPTFGGRFQAVFFLFATLYVFLYFVKTPGNKINILTLVGLFPMALYSILIFRIGAETILTWVVAPGFGLALLLQGLSLADILF